MSLESASSTSAPVKWKAREVSAKRDFFKSFQPVVTHSSTLSADRSMDSDGKSLVEQDISSDRQDCLELFQHNVGSQEKVVEVNKVILRPHKLEPEKVKPSVGADMEESVQLGSEFALDLDEVVNQVTVDDIENSEYEFVRIRLYPSPKKRNIPVDRDFPIGLMQFAQQVEQEMNKPLVSNDETQSEQSLVNIGKFIFPDDMILESDRLEMVVAHDQDESVKQESTYLTDLRSSTVVNVPRRRVSVIRCFPPGCGRDAVYLSEEDLERALADSKNHCLSCKEDDYEVVGMLEDEVEVMDEEEEQVMVEQEVDEMEEEEGKENDDEVMEEEEEGKEDDVEAEVEEEEIEEDDVEVEVVEKEDEGEEDDVEVEVEEEEEVEEVEVVAEEGEEDNVEVELVEEEEREEDVFEVEVEEVEEDDVEVELELEEEEEGEEYDFQVEVEQEGEEDSVQVEVVEEGEKDDDEVIMMTDDERETMDTKFEGQRVVVQALRASRCPCTQNAGAKPTAGRLKRAKEIRATDFKEEETVVVQALMASSRCPWRTQNQRRHKKSKINR